MYNFKIQTADQPTVDIREELTSQAVFYHFTFTFADKRSPAPLEIIWEEKDRHYYSIYTPLFGSPISLTPDWAACSVPSTICQHMPFYALLGRQGQCLYTMSLSDVITPMQISFGYVEASDCVCAKVRLFTAPCPAMERYEITLRIDKRESDIYEAGQQVVGWWRELGYGNDHVPEDAFAPVYSTWYCFHHQLDEQALLRECAIAASLGMRTLIIDDGWHIEGNGRGYAYCGDWEMAKSKFADFPAFVNKIHELGMKVMLWYSVPFVGEHTKAYERFAHMLLRYDARLHTGVFDPRYREVRDYLIGIYERAMLDYGIDGFKLDFIDSFRPDAAHPYQEGMDCYAVEEGVARLLEELRDRLQTIDPDVLIEFRQTYYGPVIGKYANMLRVGDCPGNTLRNLCESLRIRSLCDRLAAHSDMLTCNGKEDVEGFLSQFFAAFFSTPQFSFRLEELNEEKRRALGFYLSFHNAHRELILKGRLRPYGVNKGILKLESEGDQEKLVLLYRDPTAVLDGTGTVYLINARGEDGVILRADAAYRYTVRNYFGEITETGKLSAGSLTELDLKDAYLCEFLAE